MDIVSLTDEPNMHCLSQGVSTLDLGQDTVMKAAEQEVVQPMQHADFKPSSTVSLPPNMPSHIHEVRQNHFYRSQYELPLSVGLGWTSSITQSNGPCRQGTNSVVEKLCTSV